MVWDLRILYSNRREYTVRCSTVHLGIVRNVTIVLLYHCFMKLEVSKVSGTSIPIMARVFGGGPPRSYRDFGPTSHSDTLSDLLLRLQN